MRIIKIKKIEDCFDGSMIFEYFFSKKINEEYMRTIGKLGKLSYFSDFSKPFYKIISTDDFQIKGIVGEKNFQVIFPRIDKLEIKEKFDMYLMNLQNKKKIVVHYEPYQNGNYIYMNFIKHNKRIILIAHFVNKKIL